jgi:MOSC domain-containing protein YiiM
MAGTVEGIFIAAAATEAPRPVDEAEAVTGQGLRGDRYFRDGGEGTFFEPDKDGQDLTLIEVEALDHLAEEAGITLDPAAARRNVLVRGLGLNELVGRTFTVGEVECVGRRLCDPCDHLQKLTQPGVLRGLVDRGGLRADIVRGGRIAVGDAVRA